MKNLSLKKKMGIWMVLISLVAGAIGAAPGMANSDVPDNMLTKTQVRPQCNLQKIQKIAPGESCETTLPAGMSWMMNFNFSGKDYLLVDVECPVQISAVKGAEQYYVERSASLTDLKGDYRVQNTRGAAQQCKFVFQGVKGDKVGEAGSANGAPSLGSSYHGQPRVAGASW